MRRSRDAQYLQPRNKENLDRISIDGLSIESNNLSSEKELNQEEGLGILEDVKRDR